MKTLSAVHAAKRNPFTIPASIDLASPELAYPAFAALRSLETHSSAMAALLECHDKEGGRLGDLFMDRIFGFYMEAMDILDKSLKADQTVEEYVGLSVEESETLFGPPDPEDPVVTW